MKLDIIGAIEAAYLGASDESHWISGLLDSLAPLDQGAGVFAGIFRLTPEGRVHLGAATGKGVITPAILDAFQRVLQVAPPGLLRTMFAPSPPVSYASDRAGAEMERSAGDLFAAIGATDSLGILGTDFDGSGILVSAHIPRGGRRLSPAVLRQLTHLAAHLTSALRVRGAGSPSAVEAVLDARGSVLDATGPAREKGARETLAAAARRVEKARGKLRRTDPDEALALWQGLVDGMWSLVDRHDSDGKRFLLARRNEPGVKDPLALTPRERIALAYAAMGHQNKYIAYLLGIAPAKISGYLESARRKLRLRSRAELVRQFAPLVERGPE